MASTPKRQKNRDGSYTPTAPGDDNESSAPLKRKGGGDVYDVDDDTLQAAMTNKYLAHMLPESYSPQVAASRGALRDFRRRHTNGEQARKAEDGPENPFTLRPLGKTYFDILKKRRELPVHAQRYSSPITPPPFLCFYSLLILVDKSSSTCIIRHKSSYSSAKLDPEKQLKSPNSSSTTNYPISQGS